MWKEFRPAIRFVLLFVGLYFIGNIIYGLYITSKKNQPDEITGAVAQQAARILNLTGYKVNFEANTNGPTVFLKSSNRIILNIYEGCNGVNVFIVFVSFLIAFGGPTKRYFWFIPAGILLLHGCNLLRIGLLYWVAVGYQRYFYYVHKYVFTAIIYLVVFALWIIWVSKSNERKGVASAN